MSLCLYISREKEHMQKLLSCKRGNDIFGMKFYDNKV